MSSTNKQASIRKDTPTSNLNNIDEEEKSYKSSAQDRGGSVSEDKYHSNSSNDKDHSNRSIDTEKSVKI